MARNYEATDVQGTSTPSTVPVTIPASTASVASAASTLTTSVAPNRTGGGRSRGRRQQRGGGAQGKTKKEASETPKFQLTPQRGITTDVILIKHPSEKPKKDQLIVFQ